MKKVVDVAFAEGDETSEEMRKRIEEFSQKLTEVAVDLFEEYKIEPEELGFLMIFTNGKVRGMLSNFTEANALSSAAWSIHEITGGGRVLVVDDSFAKAGGLRH